MAPHPSWIAAFPSRPSSSERSGVDVHSARCAIDPVEKLRSLTHLLLSLCRSSLEPSGCCDPKAVLPPPLSPPVCARCQLRVPPAWLCDSTASDNSCREEGRRSPTDGRGARLRAAHVHLLHPAPCPADAHALFSALCGRRVKGPELVGPPPLPLLLVEVTLYTHSMLPPLPLLADGALRSSTA